MLTNRDLTNDALQILTMTRCEFFCSIFTLCLQYALLWPAKLVSQITKNLDSMSPIKRWVIQAIAQMIWWTIGTCITFYVYTILTNHFTPTTYYDNTDTETHLTNSLSPADYYDNIQTNTYFPHNIDKRQTNPCKKPSWITNYLCNSDLSTPQTSSTVPITLSTVQTYSTIAITLSTVQISSKIVITLSTVQTYNTIVITPTTVTKTERTTTTTPIPTTTIKIPRTLSTTLTKLTVTKTERTTTTTPTPTTAIKTPQTATKTTTTSTSTTVTYPKRNNVTQKVTPKNHTLKTHTVKYDAHIEITQIIHICVTCVILLIIILAIIRNIRKRSSKKNQRLNFISNHNYQYPMPGLPLDKIQNENKDIPTFKMPMDLQAQIHGTNFAKIRRTNIQKKGNTQTEPTPPPKLKTFDKTFQEIELSPKIHPNIQRQNCKKMNSPQKDTQT